ncbi:uncharacterized protein B0T15DRAFT_313270 [Chaetomium strumarium]|uniref:SET domain-containing protein n=1 Tax=Chaetomium strumarium TaxID=1170767 RepID=A0AAJ0LYT1_9PEZI|nr:hypothetical protein B0T15DRAFT_313270 [Chaetomium strumarium]
MAWGWLSLTRVLLLVLLAPLTAADADAKSKVKADPPPAGSGDGLAYESIQKVDIYTDNATAPAAQSPPVEGWWESKICQGEYCVYTNRRLFNGRGLVAVTKFEEFQKMERVDDYLNRGENKYFEDPVPFVETEVLNKGLGITANKTIRRGKVLMSWSPVLVVHKAFFNQVPKTADRARLLETAISFLHPATRAKFDKQRVVPPGSSSPNARSIEDILLAYPYEVDMGFNNYHQMDENNHSKHYVNYPEAAVLQHDCRPNVATHIDQSFSLRATVARRVQPGEELTVSYIDPFLPRSERVAWVKRHRSGGGEVGCPCSACSPPGGPKGEAAKKADARLKEITAMRAELRNHDSTKVDIKMIDRFVRLYEEERLHARLAEAYELAALNANYLGDDKRAKKYADLAVQAGIVEGGTQSNDVVAMRIMASDIKGHYSYRYTLKRRGQ